MLQPHQHVVMLRASCTCLKSLGMSDYRLDVSSGWYTLATDNLSLRLEHDSRLDPDSVLPYHNQELLKKVCRPTNDFVLVS